MMIALAVCGCDSYLDRQPDDQLTSKNIFDKKTSFLLCQPTAGIVIQFTDFCIRE